MHLLGCHVGRATRYGRRLQHSPLELARTPEVRHLDIFTGSSQPPNGACPANRTCTYLCMALVGQKDVAAVQIAVDDTLGVDVAHASRHFKRVPARPEAVLVYVLP